MNTETMGDYGNYYLKRPVVAPTGPGANMAADGLEVGIVMNYQRNLRGGSH